MYLVRFLANFAGFREFWWISRDFADLVEIRGSATARNIRSPVSAIVSWCSVSVTWPNGICTIFRALACILRRVARGWERLGTIIAICSIYWSCFCFPASSGYCRVFHACHCVRVDLLSPLGRWGEKLLLGINFLKSLMKIVSETLLLIRWLDQSQFKKCHNCVSWEWQLRLRFKGLGYQFLF